MQECINLWQDKCLHKQSTISKLIHLFENVWYDVPNSSLSMSGLNQSQLPAVHSDYFIYC